MAIKTFTTGEVLTASDTNTYLANSGLVYITSQSLATATTNVVGCFTSTYDNYRIVLSSVQMSANADIYWRMLSGSTPETGVNYAFAFLGLRVDGVADNTSNPAAAVGYTGMTQQGVANTPVCNASLDIYSPKLSQRTFMTCQANSITTANWLSRAGYSHLNLTTSYDGIQFTTLGAPTMGGTVTVYGYRKA